MPHHSQPGWPGNTPGRQLDGAVRGASSCRIISQPGRPGNTLGRQLDGALQRLLHLQRPSGQPPATPGSRSEPESSPPQGPDHRHRQGRRGRGRNARSRSAGDLDLDRRRGRGSGNLGGHRLNERRCHDHFGKAATRLTQLPPPAVDQARANVRPPRDLRNNRPRRERCSNNRPLLFNTEPPSTLGAGENMNLRHTHRLLHRCKHHRQVVCRACCRASRVGYDAA